MSSSIARFHLAHANRAATMLAVACFGGPSIAVGQPPAAVDAAVKLVETAEWEVGADGSESVPDAEELKSVYRALEAHGVAHSDDVQALILLARLARFGFSQPIALAQGQTPSTYEARFDLSIVPLKRALELQPDNAEAHYWLARTYGFSVTRVVNDRLTRAPLDLEQAIQHARRALELMPTEQRYREATAIYLAMAQRYQEANAVFDDDVGRGHIIRRILADFETIPLPLQARYLPFESAETAEDLAGRGMLESYPKLRVRTYVAEGAASVFETPLRGRWRDVEFYEAKNDQPEDGMGMVVHVQVLRERDGKLQPSAVKDVEQLVKERREYYGGVRVTLIELVHPSAGISEQYGFAGVDRFTVLSLTNDRKVARNPVALTELGKRLLGEWEIESWAYLGSRGPRSYTGTLNVAAQLGETEFEGELVSRSRSGDWGRQHMRIAVDGDQIELTGRMVAAGGRWYPDTLTLTLSGDRLSGSSVDSSGDGGRVVFVRRR